MLLARHATLGSLPATIVIAALAVVVVALGHTLIEIARDPPVLLVAEAPLIARAAPARADPAYLDAFVRGFLEDWASWTPYTVRARRARALARLAPQALAALLPASERCTPLLESLQQSQSLRIDDLQPTDLGGGRLAVRVRGRLETYFGGVGGSPDVIAGELLLETVHPTRAAPRCLAITSIRLSRARPAPASADAGPAAGDAPLTDAAAASAAVVVDPLALLSAPQGGALAARAPLPHGGSAAARERAIISTPAGDH